MEQLIKITSEPIRMIRFSQNARLVSSDNVDMERRKALARQMSMRNSAGQSGINVEDIKRINHTFSKKQTAYIITFPHLKISEIAKGLLMIIYFIIEDL